MTKYAFKIRNHHGVCIDKLHIYGRSEDESKRKLMQMYPRWEIVDTSIVNTTAVNDNFSERGSYEDIINLIART